MEKRDLLAFLAGCSLLGTMPAASGDPLTGNVHENRVARPAAPGMQSQKPLDALINENSFQLNADKTEQPEPISLTASQSPPAAPMSQPLREQSPTISAGAERSRATTGGASQNPSAAPIIDDYNAKKPLQGSVTFRFCYYDLGDGVDCCWEGLRDALYLQGRGVDIAIMLDRGGVRLANKHNGHELQLHRGSTEKMVKTHTLLKQFIENGGVVYASERWSRQFGLWGGSYPSLAQGVKLASDEEMADLLVERSGRIVEY